MDPELTIIHLGVGNRLAISHAK